MKKSFIASSLLACALLTPLCASAAPVKAFVSAFTVTPQDAAGLKETLQRLLCSRISGDDISTVDSAAQAQVVVSASYARIGKMFSLDVVAKRAANGETVATAYAQGLTEDDLIPALGTVSQKLRTEINKTHFDDVAPPAPAPQVAQAAPPVPVPVPAQALPETAPAKPVLEPAPQPKAQQAAQPQQVQGQAGSTLWTSPRIVGAQASIAPAGNIAGAKVLFLADGHKIKAFRQGKGLTQIAEASIPLREKLLSIDTIGSESAGSIKLFVTCIDGDTPSSRVYTFKDGKLTQTADELPYMFRAVALNGGPTRIYAQEMGRVDDFYGDVYEVTENAGKIELKNPIKLPSYGNIFNFNKFTDADGKSYFTVFSSDGYLIVYSDAGEELWRSLDKMGGSETYFVREYEKSPNDFPKWRFLDQRITVTAKGEIIVPQNEGLFVIGNQRSYKKYALSCFTWNGSVLEERWKTKLSPSYLADYFFDPATRELVLLEVVQKEGIFGKGGSAVRIVKAD